LRACLSPYEPWELRDSEGRLFPQEKVNTLPIIMQRTEAVQWGLLPALESPQAAASEESLNDPAVSIQASTHAQGTPEQPETPPPAPAADAALKSIEPTAAGPAPAEPPAILSARGGEPSPAQSASQIQSEMSPPATQPNERTVADPAPGYSEPAATKKQVRRAKKRAKKRVTKRVKRQGPDRYGEADRALFPEMAKLMKDEQLSAQEAAKRLGDLGKIARRGTLESAVHRLAKRYRDEREKPKTA